MDKRLLGDLAFGTRFIFYGETYTKIALEILTHLLDAGAKPKGTALLSAARCRNLDQSSKMVEALLRPGADPNYKDYYMGDRKRFSTPLHAACYQGNYPVVELLLRQPAIELDTIDIKPIVW